MKMAVVGAGAIGGVVGALLDKAGADVVLIDTDAAHVAAIQQNGLRIEEDGRSERIRVRASGSPAELDEPLDLVFLAVKSTATAAATRSILPNLKPDAIVVSLQNGMGNEDVIADIVGGDRMLAGVVGWGATFSGPGHITRTSSEGGFEVGEWTGGMSKRARRVARILNHVAPTVAHENIHGAKWTKLIINATINSLGALAGMRLGEMVDDPRTRVLLLKLVTEGVRVARADGVTLEKVNGSLDMRLLELATAEEFQALRDASTPAKLAFISKYKGGLAVKNVILKRMATKHGHIKSSMWQDIERGLRTEIDVLNGYIVERARATGTAAPLSKGLVRMIRAIERGERVIDYANVYELETEEFNLPEERKLEETTRTAAFFFVSLTETFAKDLGWSGAAELVSDAWEEYERYYAGQACASIGQSVNALDAAGRRWQAIWFDRHGNMTPETEARPGEIVWSSPTPCQYWTVARSLGIADRFEFPVCRTAAKAAAEGAGDGISTRVVQRGCQGDDRCTFVFRGAAEETAEPAAWPVPDERELLLNSSNAAGFFFVTLTRLAAREIGWERANAGLERFWENLGTTFTRQVLMMFQVKDRDPSAALRTLIFLLFNRHPDMIPNVLDLQPDRVVAQNIGGCRYWHMATELGAFEQMDFPACLPLITHLTATVNPAIVAELTQRQCQGDGCCELRMALPSAPPRRMSLPLMGVRA